MKRVLLCPPTHFDVEYEINPWMHMEIQPEAEGTLAAYDQLKQKFTGLGFEIHEIEQVKGLPDMVYTANVGNLFGNTFIKSNFKFDERKKEADYAAEYLHAKFGFTIAELPDHINYEGQGDLLTDGKRYFFGWGKRSDYLAKAELEGIMGVELIDFKLVDPYYYHLDTCFAPLSPEIVMINPRSFTEEGLQKVYEVFPTVIETTEEDNKYLACNLVVAGKTIVVGKGITQSTKDKLATLGYNTYEIDMHEYLKGGGSVKCCTFEF